MRIPFTVLALTSPLTSPMAHDDERLQHLVAGELPGLGLCPVTCGYSELAIVVGRNAVGH